MSGAIQLKTAAFPLFNQHRLLFTSRPPNLLQAVLDTNVFKFVRKLLLSDLIVVCFDTTSEIVKSVSKNY